MAENTFESIDIDQVHDDQVEQLDPSQMATGKRKKKTSRVWEHFTKVLIIDPDNPNGPKISKARCNYYKDFF